MISFPPKLGENASLVTDMLFPAGFRRNVKRVCSAWKTDREIVHDLPEKHGIFCHPPPADIVPNMTVGMIEGIKADRPIRITAKGIVNSREAAPVEFALAAAPPGIDVMATLGDARRGNSGELCASGWIEGSFGHDAFISLFVPPNSVPQRLFLATRMANAATNDYAWSSFEDLRITHLGPQEIGVIRSLTVPPSQLSQVINPFDSSDALVSYNLNEQAILCHPMRSGIKIGVISELVPEDAIGVRANVRLAHEKAQPVAFGLALSALPGEQVLAQIENTLDGRPHLAFSGWLQVETGSTHKLEVSAAGLKALPGDKKHLHLYLLTRMVHETETSDWAWAQFSNIEIIHPNSEVL